MVPSSDGYGTSFMVRIPLWPYLITPIACVIALPGTGLLHYFFGRGVSAGWTGFCLALASVGIVLFTSVAARPRGVVMRWMATGNALLSCLWIVPAVLNGPFTKPMIGTWLLGTALMSVAVAVYRIMREARGAEGGQGTVLQGEFAELGDAVKQLKDVGFSRPTVAGAKASTNVTMPAGRTFAEVAGARAELASVLDVPATAIRTEQSPDSERRGKVHVVPVDQLRSALQDPGLSAPGETIALPIVLGRTEEGEDAEIILPGDPSVHRNAVGVMGIVGMSGSGKTELLLRLIGEIATRHDSEFAIADPRKGGQLPKWVTRAATRVAFGPDDAADLLEDIPAEVQRRAKQLGDKGYKQWQEGCGIPFRTYVIFEAAAVIAGNSTVVDLAESVRSVGICLILEMQRATYDRLPTSARSNITTWVVLGVQRDDDAEAALSEDTIAAGAAPWKWKNAKPGYFYLEWAGRPNEQWSAPNRSFILGDEERAAMVGQALGWKDTAAEQEPAADAGAAEAGAADAEERVEVNAAVDPEEPPDDVDETKPITVPTGMPRLPLGEAVRKMSPDDARGLLLQHIEDLGNAGVDTFAPADLSVVLGSTGLSGSWLYKELKSLSQGEAAVLRYTPRGRYKILQLQRT